MIPISFPVCAVFQRLDSGFVLAEGLGFPEISRLGPSRRPVRDALRRNLRRMIAAEPLTALYRRFAGDEPAVTSVTVPLEPAGTRAGWRKPLLLSFAVVTWESGGAMLAFVPALGIEVIAESAEDLASQLPAEIRAAMARGPDLTLERLVGLQRIVDTKVERLTIGVPLRSAKARALAAEREGERLPSVLARVTTDLTRQPPEPIFGLGPLIAELAELLTSPAPRGILLIGPSGVGKTAALHELARLRSEFGLGATPFWATSRAAGRSTSNARFASKDKLPLKGMSVEAGDQTTRIVTRYYSVSRSFMLRNLRCPPLFRSYFFFPRFVQS